MALFPKIHDSPPKSYKLQAALPLLPSLSQMLQKQLLAAHPWHSEAPSQSSLGLAKVSEIGSTWNVSKNSPFWAFF